MIDNQRIKRVRAALCESGADACYLRKTTNIQWVTGFEDVFDEEAAHALIITPDQAIIHSDSRYVDALEREAHGSEFRITTDRVSHAKFLSGTIDKSKRVLIEDTLSLREFRQLETEELDLIETTNFIEGLRASKDPAEIEFMRKAQEITDEAFSHIITYIKPGMSEAQVQRELDRFMLEKGVSGLAFPTIVATGAHAASPHAIPDNRPLQVGDAVVMDFGARYNDYCSDMTRTVFIGEPSEELKKAYSIIREANETCEELLRAGKTGAEIHQAAEDILSKHGYAGRMGHGLGHSLGLDIHEDPSLAPRNTEPLPVGATVTVEPGIYLSGKFGMRLEDFGVVTEEGFEVLTQSTHDMVIIDAPNS